MSRPPGPPVRVRPPHVGSRLRLLTFFSGPPLPPETSLRNGALAVQASRHFRVHAGNRLATSDVWVGCAYFRADCDLGRDLRSAAFLVLLRPLPLMLGPRPAALSPIHPSVPPPSSPFLLDLPSFPRPSPLPPRPLFPYSYISLCSSVPPLEISSPRISVRAPDLLPVRWQGDMSYPHAC